MRVRYAGRSLSFLVASIGLFVAGRAAAQTPGVDSPSAAPLPDPPPLAPPPPLPAPPQMVPAPVYPQPAYAQPAYPYPYSYPPAVVARPQPQVAWVIADWDPDAPEPPGFHKSTGVNTGLIARGATLLGSAWLVSAATAAIGSSTDEPSRRSAWTPLFVPLVGPFVAAGTLKPTRGGDIGGIVLDAGVQTVGALGILVGMLDERSKLVRVDANAPTPLTGPTGVGGGPRLGFVTSGAILGGLGTLTLLAGGITWLTAAANTAALSHDCPDHRCVRGTPGADELVTARKTARATDVLTTIGLPTAGVGYSLLILGSGFGKGQVRVEPSVGMVRGATVSGSF